MELKKGLRIRITLMRIRIQLFTFNTDPDSAFHLMRTRILLLNKVMQICDRWSTDPGLHLSLQGSILSF
jgi:hypothetical protein